MANQFSRVFGRVHFAADTITGTVIAGSRTMKATLFDILCEGRSNLLLFIIHNNGGFWDVGDKNLLN